MVGAASELGFMHSGAIVEGGSICKNNRVLFCPQSMSQKSQISEDKTCHFDIGQARNACLCLYHVLIFRGQKFSV